MRRYIFLAVVFLLFTAHVVLADQVVVQNTGIEFGMSTQPNPCVSNDPVWGCAFSGGLAPLDASSSFIISKIDVVWGNNGANNCDGIGNADALVTTAPDRSTLIASSTNSVYVGCAGFGGGNHGTGEFLFPASTTIPAHFYLTIASPDGVQGGAQIGVGNVVISGDPIIPPKEPVVIVPGVMGSTLDRTSDGQEVWPDALNMFLSFSDDYLDGLEFSGTGEQTTAMQAGEIIKNELGLPVYGGLVDAVTADGYTEGTTLFTVPYDWRTSIVSSASELSAVFHEAEQASPDGKINVIAHSMGGLLVKQYLMTAPDTSFINKLILIAVPQLGAPEAFKFLNYGDDFGLNWFGLGLNQDEAKAIAQNMPGIYELLPSERYVSVNGGYIKDMRNGVASVLDYGETNDLMTSDPADTRNPALLSDADSVHDAIDSQQFNMPAAKVYNIMGCGINTLSGFDLYDDDEYGIDVTQGDDTVPLTSAINLSDGYNTFFDLADGHMELLQKTAPLQLIANILSDSPGPLPEGISTSLSDCSPDGDSADTLLVSVHGPAALDVYDELGDHTGPSDASSTIELGIPDSEYEVIGKDAFVILPKGHTYKLIAESNATGTLDIKTEVLHNAKPTKKTSYLSVPVKAPKAKAEIDVTNITDSPPLDLTSEDSDTPATTIQPTSILTSDISADVTPPVITISAIPPDLIVGATTTFTFSATDEESGVASIEGTLDGEVISSGEVVTIQDPGTNTLKVVAEDNAGNPSVETVTFTTDARNSCIL